MASNYTPDHNLCQWEAGDQVLREDFNEDNRKIETALNDRNCCVINFTHTGRGETKVGSSPYRRALSVFIVGDGYSLAMVRPADKAVCYSATGQTALVDVIWDDQGLVWSTACGDPAFVCNKANTTYACLYILSTP